jgi:hypothetical protein
LKITTAAKTGAAEKGYSFKLVLPPKQPYVQYYGYEVSPAWLVQFAEHHYPQGLPDRNDKSYNATAIRLAYDIIRDWDRVYTLATEHCFPVPPEWIASMHDEGGEPEDLQIVLSVCSDEESDLEWLPVQERMDFLTKLIGHGPKWWPSREFTALAHC